jgi:hypothetical protein
MQTKKHLSLIVHAIYVILTGLQLIFVPNMVLDLFGIAPTTEIWIKILGLVVFSLSFMYYAISQHGSREVIQSSVYARSLVSLGFILFVLFGQVQTSLIFFACIDAATSIWTWMELKKEA